MSEADWKQFFDVVDTDGTGKISCKELANLLKAICDHEKVPKTPAELQDEAKALISAVDKDNDGEMSWDEFRKAMKEAKEAK